MAPVDPHSPSAPSGGDDGVERDRIKAAELTKVLSHYDLGVVRRLRSYPRGSRRSPKVRITAGAGEFLLKRRAPGRDAPERVAFAHDLLLKLAAGGYPVPELIRPRHGDGGTMVCLDGRTYELFGFVTGRRESGTADAARAAGAALGRFHRSLADHRPCGQVPATSFHAALGLESALARIPAIVATVDPNAPRAALEDMCGDLRAAYVDACRRVEGAGFAGFSDGVVHGDWHPGNLIFREGAIAAVLDFDSAHMEPRVVDLANAALQFSMRMTGGEHPDRWPDDLEVKRMEALVDGYNRFAATPVSAAEREALPWLIIEALVIESVVPVAATGRFATIDGGAFLRMVRRKIAWLRPRAQRLSALLASSPS